VIVSPQKSSNTLEAPVRAPSGPHRKPKADLYTVLLAIALLAVLVAILFLWLEMRSYEFKSKGAPAVPMAAVQGSEVRVQGIAVSDQRSAFSELVSRPLSAVRCPSFLSPIPNL
jgi:hypothetical protein